MEELRGSSVSTKASSRCSGTWSPGRRPGTAGRRRGSRRPPCRRRRIRATSPATSRMTSWTGRGWASTPATARSASLSASGLGLGERPGRSPAPAPPGPRTSPPGGSRPAPEHAAERVPDGHGPDHGPAGLERHRQRRPGNRWPRRSAEGLASLRSRGRSARRTSTRRGQPGDRPRALPHAGRERVSAGEGGWGRCPGRGRGRETVRLDSSMANAAPEAGAMLSRATRSATSSTLRLSTGRTGRRRSSRAASRCRRAASCFSSTTRFTQGVRGRELDGPGGLAWLLYATLRRGSRLTSTTPRASVPRRAPPLQGFLTPDPAYTSGVHVGGLVACWMDIPDRDIAEGLEADARAPPPRPPRETLYRTGHLARTSSAARAAWHAEAHRLLGRRRAVPLPGFAEHRGRRPFTQA